ncbi:Fez family zinc finger protein erm [Amphibalanus amphitrite]|uniref:Fez family zinc finger protein erm n=2 Tax=Amphibalanus amphitrite TaxID=1232801 RepID=A0A6A4VBN4_AMPAM|nr:Fez family zinc finger protein erm [Amphibalanus amphitrite]
MASGATTYLCPECGLSFGSQHQLRAHRAAAHVAAERQTVVREPPGRAPPHSRPDEPVHSHSWPPHDHRPGERLEQRLEPLRMAAGERLEPRLEPQRLGERLEPRLEPRLELPERLPWERPPLLGDRREPPLRLPLHLLRPQHDLSPFLPPLGGLGNGRGLLPGLLPGLRRHLTPPAASAAAGLLDSRSPLDLSTVDGTPGTSPPAASPSGERSAPSTPTPTEDGNPVTCKYCTRMFDSIAALMDHMPVHQGDRPFLCEWCKKGFKFRHHLKDHSRIHTGERPFECRTCGKTFARSSILKTHTKIHRQEGGRRFDMVGPFPSPAAPEPPEMPLPGTTLPEMAPLPIADEGAAQAQ